MRNLIPIRSNEKPGYRSNYFSSRHFAFSFVEVEGYAYVRGAG